MGGKTERGMSTDPMVRVSVFWLLLFSERSENHRLRMNSRDEVLEV